MLHASMPVQYAVGGVQRCGIGVSPSDWRAKAVAQRSSPRSPLSQGTLFGLRFAKVTNHNPTGKGIIFKRLYLSNFDRRRKLYEQSQSYQPTHNGAFPRASAGQ